MKFDMIAGHNVQDTEGNIWVWDRLHNLIGFFQGENFDFHIAGQFEENDFYGFGIFLRENVIYITAQDKAEILAYDIKDNFFRVFRSDICLKASQYYSAELDYNRMILFSYELEYGSVIFNILNGQFEKGPLLKLDRSYNSKVISRLSETEKEIIIAVSNSNELLVISKEDMSYTKLRVPFIDDIGGVCGYCTNCLWVISKNADRLIQYCNNESLEIIIGEKKEGDLFSRLVIYGGKVIAIPRYAEELYIYDTLKKKIELVKIPMDVKRTDNRSSLFWDCYEKDNKLILLPWAYPYILEVDLDTLGVGVRNANVSTDEFIKYGLPEIIYEDEEMRLDLLFKIVGKSEVSKKNRKQIGTKIWENQGMT